MTAPIVLCARECNDLARALTESGHRVALYATPEAAVEAAGAGSGVLILSDDYPIATHVLSAELLAAARAKDVRLYIEYPLAIAGTVSEEARTIRYERLIVCGDLFAPALEKDAILMINGCWHRPLFGKGPGLLALAKAAGYDALAYGLPEDAVCALDYWDADQTVLAATTALSRFATARYAPTERWRALWQGILRFLGYEVALRWTPTVSITAGSGEPLPPDAEARALADNLRFMARRMIGKVDNRPSVFEGYESAIDFNGVQFLRPITRSDCMGETAMELAYAAEMFHRPDLRKLASDIVSQAVRVPEFYNDDPASSMYGLNNWYENGRIFYGDDNARMLLGALSVRSLSGDSQWDEKLLRCVLANLRTSGTNGLRQAALRQSSFAEKSWMDYYNETRDEPSPHYEAYLWAVFIWMYALTGLEELLEKSKRAIRLTMERFPDRLRWQNSMTGEITRMLLPLSFLLRVEPCAEHEAWLRRTVEETLRYQVPCGAIRDAFGALELGKYPPPQSNERYGTSEASIIQQNGDPATDLLYTTNWAFIGLHEAALVLDDPRIREAADRLADFLCRIQVRSTVHPELDGAWMRSFDYEKWEYWGSSSDIGWSAWCVESGWVNAWIGTTLMLRRKNRSLMCLDAKEALTAIAPELYRQMLTPSATREKAPAPAPSAMPGVE